jgi:Ser/Thr protein kinase RdoA (MazF antagonist)
MSDLVPPELIEIVNRFRIDGEVVAVARHGAGHIHETYVSDVRTSRGSVRFLHQRINRTVFPSPERVMENIERVTEHLRGKFLDVGENPERRTLTIVPTVDGRRWLRTPAGDTWRSYRFIEGARTYDVATGPDHVRNVARAFGLFQSMMRDLPGPRLHETIPHFADTRRRFDALLEALDADVSNRAARVRPEIDFALAHEPLASLLVDLAASGRVPERVVHHDTKINNVLIDDETGQGICVIDLDTVMPGTELYDFGDSVRFGSSAAAEDELDLDRVRLDVDWFEHLARGYLEVARDFLEPVEVDHLVPAAAAVTFTAGVRFLTDYLAGDSYFRVQRGDHNLDRCRVQFALLREIEDKFDRLQTIISALR